MSELTMPVIVVGGCAAGSVLPRVRADAKIIELAAPLYRKPLESPDQEQPEIVYMRDQYEIHPIALTNSDAPDRASLVGIAAVKGMTLTEAFSLLISAYSAKVYDDAAKKQPEDTPTKH